MIKIVSGPADLVGFDVNQFYTVHDLRTDVPTLVAIACTAQEAHDAGEMIQDLRGGNFHIAPPRALAN